MTGGVHSGGHVCWGACIAGSMCGRGGGHVWQGVCMAGGICGRGHAWQGGVCGGGYVWQGACMAGGACMSEGHVWQEWGHEWQGWRACISGGMCGRRGMHGGGVHGRGHAWQGVCMVGGHVWWGHAWQEKTAIAAGSMHPTGMHSCSTCQCKLPLA